MVLYFLLGDVLGNKTIIKVTNKTKKRFKNRINNLYKYNYNEIISIIASYKGHLKYGCCKELIYNYIKFNYLNMFIF